MNARDDGFEESVRQQIALNGARSGSERMLALCELLDAARAMAPRGAAARERRLRARAARLQDREKWRAQYRRFLAADGADASSGV